MNTEKTANGAGESSPAPDGSEFPTSPQLEAIVAGFRLRICEVVRGFHEDGSPVFRFDFVAQSDDGTPMVCGSSCCVFPTTGTPRDFAMTLRMVANNLDAYWARAFPGALPNATGEFPAQKHKEKA
jgi:hypothetical protein